MPRQYEQQNGGDDDVLRMFFGGGQQQAQVNPMALALQILGLGRQERETAADLALRREALAAQEKSRSEETTGRQATQLHQQTMEQFAKEAAEREQKHREALLGFEKEKLGVAQTKGEMDALLEHFKANPGAKLEEYQKAMAPYSPTQRQVLASTLEQSQKAKAKELGEAVQALYGKRAPMEVFENLVKDQPEEVMARVPWQELAAGAPVSQTEQLTQGAGAAGLLWNVPGALQNVGKGIVNTALSLGGGENAPQVPYTEFTDPYAEVPRYREAQALMNMLNPSNVAGPGVPTPPLGTYLQGQEPPRQRYLGGY